MKVEAWKWLTEECGKWDACQDKKCVTSVDPEKCQGSWKCDESLKEFLKPAMQNVNLKRNKHGKKITTHAQVLGINVESEVDKKQGSKKDGNTTKKTKVEEKKQNDEFKIVIDAMKNQMTELQNIIHLLCNSIVGNYELKIQCLEKISHSTEKSVNENE